MGSEMCIRDSYKTTNYYDAASDRSMNWADPDLAIDWSASVDEDLLSDKDRSAPGFAELTEKGDVFV